MKSLATLLEAVDQPLIDLFNQETSLQAELREETVRSVSCHQMMTTPLQVQFLQCLMRLMSAKRAIEIGVFTGYGTLAMAEALPDEGQLIACDRSAEWVSIGEPYWERAGVAGKIDVRLGAAIEVLQSLVDEGLVGQFDFIFIDADKPGYPDYFRLSDQLLRENGLMVFDNVILMGQERVAERQTAGACAIAALLESITQDARYETSLLPIAQGVVLARKCYATS